jgi:phosphate transport system substrate-binding protein
MDRYSVFFIFILCLFSCQNKDPKEMRTPVVGKMEIWCDESLKTIIQQHEEVFESSYKYADLDVKYADELTILKKFYGDSTDVIIMARMLDSTIMKALNKQSYFPRQYKFGKSAIAFVTNKSNPKVQYEYKEILKLLSEDGQGQSIAIENMNSGIASELLRYTKKEKLSSNVYALKNKDEIFEWLNKNPNGIGIIDWCELSDSDDPIAQARLQKVKLLQIKNDSTFGKYVEPYQYNLNGLYPFTRDLFIIRKLGVSDVSLGFASFVCEERGQKILLKAGLLPEYQTERWIEFKGLKDVKVIQ